MNHEESIIRVLDGSDYAKLLRSIYNGNLAGYAYTMTNSVSEAHFSLKPDLSVVVTAHSWAQ